MGKKVTLTIYRENQKDLHLPGMIISSSIDDIEFETLDGNKEKFKIREISFIQMDE